jgi:hypothetical protein
MITLLWFCPEETPESAIARWALESLIFPYAWIFDPPWPIESCGMTVSNLKFTLWEKNKDYCQRFEVCFRYDCLHGLLSTPPRPKNLRWKVSRFGRAWRCWEPIPLMTPPCKSNMSSLEWQNREGYAHIATTVALIVVTRHGTMLSIKSWASGRQAIRVCPRAGNLNTIDYDLQTIVRDALRVCSRPMATHWMKVTFFNGNQIFAANFPLQLCMSWQSRY